MVGKQEGVYGVIYPFGHVVYDGGGSRLPQQRLSGKAAEDHCPWYGVLHFLAEVAVGYPHFFNKIF